MEELEKHQYWMTQALIWAKKAGEKGEIPVGALIVDDENKLIACGGNEKESTQDSTAHAEMVVIRQASQILNNWRLNNCTIYVTLEPCPMCMGAIIQSRVKTLVYGVDDFKTGSARTMINLCDHPCSHHHITVFGGIQHIACEKLLRQWFTSNMVRVRS